MWECLNCKEKNGDTADFCVSCGEKKGMSPAKAYIPEKKPIDNTYTYSNQSYSDSSVWIKGLRILTWLLFFFIIIIGICAGVVLNDFPMFLVCLLGSSILAFLSVAFIMIILDVAEDIRQIRINTYK